MHGKRMRTLSVIIGTYNRALMLKDTLESLVDQETNGSFGYEVIVADNNSKDATQQTVASLMPRFKGRLRYLFEPQQGKSYALNAAIRQARGEYVVFTDDDVLCDRRWLAGYWTCFDTYKADAAGGRILTLFPPDAPGWIREVKDIVTGPMVHHDFGKTARPYDFDHMPPFFGANMAVRKTFFEEHGLFRHDLGAGRSATGEDTEVFRRLQILGKKIYYAGGALLYHRTGKDRFSYRYIARWTIGSGRSNTRRRTDMRRFVSFFGIPRHLFRELAVDTLHLAGSILNRRKFTRWWMKVFFDVGVAQEFRRKNLLLARGDPEALGLPPPGFHEDVPAPREAAVTGE